MTMRRRLVWMVSVVVAAVLSIGLVACGTSTPTDEPKEDVEVEGTDTNDTPGNDSTDGTDAQDEKPIGVAMNLSDDSILAFDGNAGSAQLVEDMRAGTTPTSCTIHYDLKIENPDLVITDARTIRDLYKKLARMHVEEETDDSIADLSKTITFELQDGTTVEYNFMCEEILMRDGKNYKVSDDSNLWAYVRDLQEQFLEEQAAGPDALAITLDDEDEMVMRCPKSAVPGSTVLVKVYTVLDAERHVAVNDDEYYGEFVGAEEFEFIMPDEPVTVHVWLSSDGYYGS